MQLEPLRGEGRLFPTTTRFQKLQRIKTREMKYFLAWIFFPGLCTYRKYIVQFIIHILKIFSISVLHSLRDVLLFISGTIEARPFFWSLKWETRKEEVSSIDVYVVVLCVFSGTWSSEYIVSLIRTFRAISLHIY